MKIKVFSVYDSKVQAYMHPFFAPTVGAATRQFGDAVANPEGDFSKHPDDYTLFQVGEWDDSAGIFLEFPAPVSMGNALEYVAKTVESPKVVRRSAS